MSMQAIPVVLGFLQRPLSPISHFSSIFFSRPQLFFTTSTFLHDFNLFIRPHLFFYDLNFFSRLQHSGTTLTFQHDFNFLERLLLNNAYKCLRWDWMSSCQNFMGIRLWWNVNNQIVFVLTHVKQFFWRFKEKQSLKRWFLSVGTGLNKKISQSCRCGRASWPCLYLLLVSTLAIQGTSLT